MLTHRRSGTSLVEILFVLCLIGVLLMLGGASYGSARDVAAVRAARDEIVAASARTRAYAVRHGGGALTIDGVAGTLRIVTRDSAINVTEVMSDALGVTVAVDGSRGLTSATLQYDALGIGRLASRTITLSRGSVSGGVTFSAYGRPRIW
jgi:Tfp pilus assembly protein FimT